MILSFADQSTEKIFTGTPLSRKESKFFGDLRIEKAQERLLLLNASSEKQLLLVPPAQYHSLKGSKRYSIDANSRTSKWRITFSWKNEDLTDVELVKIEDTHK